MDLGREIIAACLTDKSALKRFIEEGFGLDWLNDKEDLSRAAIFGENDIEAYRFILKTWARNHAVPSKDYFQHSFPPQSFRLPVSDLTVPELIAMAQEDRSGVQLHVTLSSAIDLHDEGRYEETLVLMEAEAKRIRRARWDSRVLITRDSAGYDREARLSRKEQPGIKTGIHELDKAFAGWQPGQLVTYLGRAKACKTSHLIKAALKAYEDQFSVLIVSVEMNAASIADRCDVFAAGVEPEALATGHLTDAEKRALESVWKNLSDEEAFNIIQPVAQYTLTDLEADIDRFNPDACFIDGFYFLTDRVSGKSGGQWEGHDNLARELKEIALRRELTIVTTMQVREKQARRGSLDDNAMMGGTGLLMASDMVLTLDMDSEGLNTIACSRSRTRYLPAVRGHWHWKTSTFMVDDDQWSAGEDDDD